jgi:ABC-2 type transport system ATP-binding protein
MSRPAGLDPLLQHEFVAMVRQAKANGQTVFMSSHVLGEVQQTADRVGIIREGVLIATEQVENLRKRAIRRVEIIFDRAVTADEFAVLPGLSDVTVDGQSLRCRLNGLADPAIVAVAAGYGAFWPYVQSPDMAKAMEAYCPIWPRD